MNKFSGLLFCTDLDGTLYSGNKTVSAQNLSAIRFFQSQGGLFTFITGRVPQTSENICRIVRPNAPYGCLNGGGIYDPAQQAYLWNTVLPDAVLEIIRDVRTHFPDMGIQFNCAGGIYFAKDNPAMQRFRDVTGLPLLTCRCDEPPEPLLKIVFSQLSEPHILALADYLNHHPLAPLFEFIRSERYLYEILPKGASKGSVLTKMAALLNIAPAKTIAVGDYDNDVSMLRAAGLSFAVANANAAARSAAQHLTVSNNDHAIAAIINALDRGLYKL